MFQAKNAFHNWLLSVALSELKFVFRVLPDVSDEASFTTGYFLIVAPRL
jgi:hypothetical protein